MTDQEKPRVSIIVPVYNGGKLFQRTVASLEQLTYPPGQLQIILINDGSTDQTGSWLQARRLPAHFEIITHQANRGRAATRNSGLITAGGDFIIFLDGDMLVKQDFAEQHVKALSQPGIEAVSGRMIPAPELKRTRLQRYLFEYPRRGSRQFGENKHLPFQYLITGNMSITRKAADAVGLFDEGFRGYGGEDILYAYKLWKIFPGGIRYSAAAVAIDQHQYELEALLEKYYHYGKFNLPRLLNDYPDMTPALRADYIVGKSLKRLLGDLLLNKVFFSVGKLKYKIMPYPLSNWLLRLLLLGALRKGYKQRGINKKP